MSNDAMIVALNIVVEVLGRHDLKLLVEDYKRLREENERLREQLKDAEERGAREMAERMTCDCEDCAGENWQRDVDNKVQLWRDGRGK